MWNLATAAFAEVTLFCFFFKEMKLYFLDLQALTGKQSPHGPPQPP